MRTYITQEHIKSARDRKLADGLFGPLGLYNVRDKYAREKMDGSQEDWYDICARVVNGNCRFFLKISLSIGTSAVMYTYNNDG
jgi:hypothetical protein